MTISSELRKAGPYSGNGSTTVFSFGFAVQTAADLLVVRTQAGVETVLVAGTHYSVTLNPNQDASPGGTVTLLTAPSVGQSITLTTQIPYTQGTQLSNLGGFYPNVINRALDRLTILIQQVRETASRSVRLALSTPASVSPSLPVPVANKLLAWNSTATALENVDAPSGGGGGGGGTGADGQDGADGVDAVSGFLTLPSVVLPANEFGNVSNYSTAVGSFKVYQGTDNVTLSCTFSVTSNPDALTATIDAAGNYAVTGGMDALDASSVVFQADFGTTVITLPFAVNKARAGTRGSKEFFGTNASWSDSVADSVVAGTGLTKVILDRVTLTSGDFSESRYWSGTNWVAIGQVISGNMLIDGAVLARHLAAGSVTAEKLAVLSSSGMKIDMSNGTIVCTDGVVMTCYGSGFGANSGSAKFLEWYGPYLSDVAQCTDANGFTWKKRNGAYKDWDGIHTLSIGASVNTTSTATNAEITTGSFASAGGTIQVSLSYEFAASSGGFISPQAASNTSGATQAIIDLYRSINGGAESIIATLTCNGTWSIEISDPFEVPGFGTVSTLGQGSSCNGSLVYTDPATLAQPRVYRAVKRTTPHPTDLGLTTETQKITIVATET